MIRSTSRKIIEIENLTKSFGRFDVLDDVNLTIKKGEVFGFLGPNGAGKTTTIRIILNVLKPTKGSVTLFGISNRRVKEVHKRLGYLSGDMVLEEDLTGAQYLKFVNHAYGGGNEDRIDDLADLFEIDLGTKIRDYSRGNEQKVGLIAAIMHKPELLILDEPTSGFDPIMQEAFAKIILDFKKQGGTVLMSSHILSEIQQLCDRIAFIKEGRIVGVRDLNGLSDKSTKRVVVYPLKNASRNEALNYRALSGLNLIKRGNASLTFSYNGDVKKLLRFFSTQNIRDITIEEPDLEEVFLDYYKNKGKR